MPPRTGFCSGQSQRSHEQRPQNKVERRGIIYSGRIRLPRPNHDDTKEWGSKPLALPWGSYFAGRMRPNHVDSASGIWALDHSRYRIIEITSRPQRLACNHGPVSAFRPVSSNLHSVGAARGLNDGDKGPRRKLSCHTVRVRDTRTLLYV